jgi:hypothetical protein
MVSTPPSELFAELIDAIALLRGFFDARDDRALTPTELRTLERLVERYQRANDAVSTHMESIIQRSTRRPRR